MLRLTLCREPARAPELRRDAPDERAQELRKKAFERAMKDNKWDWIAEHMGELEGDTEFKARIAAAAKEKGLVRSEGKDYVMQDGDVTLFRFNV